MSNKLLLCLLSILFLLSIQDAAAQTGGCTNPRGSAGAVQCYPNYANVCLGGQWTQAFSPSSYWAQCAGSRECNPGANQCYSNYVRYCDGSGHWQTAFSGTSAFNQYCPSQSVCINPQGTPGQVSCPSPPTNFVRICQQGPNGPTWAQSWSPSNLARCGIGTRCTNPPGEIGQIVCSPRPRQCVRGPNGPSWVNLTTTPPECRPPQPSSVPPTANVPLPRSTGCVNPAGNEGTSRCLPTSAQVCRSGRWVPVWSSSPDFTRYCPRARQCTDGTIECPRAGMPARRCVGGQWTNLTYVPGQCQPRPASTPSIANVPFWNVVPKAPSPPQPSTPPAANVTLPQGNVQAPPACTLDRCTALCPKSVKNCLAQNCKAC